MRISTRLIVFFVASVLTSVGTVAVYSFLLRSSAASWNALAESTKGRAEGSLALVGMAARVQGLVLKLLREENADALEALIAQGETATQDVKAAVQQAGAGTEALAQHLTALGAANEKAKQAALLGQGAQANAIFINESNPAFERLLEEIRAYEGAALAALGHDASQAATRLEGVQTGAAAVVAAVVLALTGLGLTLVRGLARALRDIVERARDVAEGEGDLTKRLPVVGKDELAQVSHWFNGTLDKIHKAMTQVAAGTHRLASASEQLSASSAEQSRSGEAQRDQTHQVAVAMEEMSCTVTEVSRNSNEAAEASARAAASARHGGEVVTDALSKMRQIADSVGQTAGRVKALGESSDRIGEIIGVIDDIANQTNLLALNAAIEAARAGEQGRGFAVVADEVRKLAERTSQATKEIGEMIHTIQTETTSVVAAMEAGTALVQEGLGSTAEAGASLKDIIHVSEQVGGMVTQIATAATEQAAATEQVNASVERIAGVTAEAARAAQETAAAAGSLSQLAAELQGLVGQFRLCADANP